MAEKQTLSSSRTLPLVMTALLFALCMATVMVPRLGFPLFAGVSMDAIKGLSLLFQGVTNVDSLTSAFSWSGLWQAVQSSGALALNIFFILLAGLILTVLFLFAAGIIGIAALVQSLRARTRSAFLLLFWAALLVVLAILIGNLAIMFANSLFDQLLQDKVWSLGLEYQNIRYVVPTLWSWATLAAAFVLAVVSLILRRQTRAAV